MRHAACDMRCLGGQGMSREGAVATISCLFRPFASVLAPASVLVLVPVPTCPSFRRCRLSNAFS